MQYFTEQASSHREALDRIQVKYGSQAKILTQRSVRFGGFFGMFAREGVELSGYISQEKSRAPRMEEEKQKILKNVRDEQTIQQVLEEVQKLQMKIDSAPAAERVVDDHESLVKIEELLFENDFTQLFVRETMSRLRREISLDDLDDFKAVQDRVVDWIAEAVHIIEPTFETRPKVLVLVGPTGVGKTTTIAKLAAIHGLGTSGNQTKRVRMITIDNYRIGARQQIETYGEIMGIPVSCAESYDDLRRQIALAQDADLILIDTIGKSPKDYIKLAEMRELLDAGGSRAQVLLALSATTKTADIGEILQQFEPFHFEAIALTKLDETMRIGNMISVLSAKNKGIAYITDGQVVPQDIEVASVSRILMHLDGFIVDQEHIEALYGVKV